MGLETVHGDSLLLLPYLEEEVLRPSLLHKEGAGLRVLQRLELSSAAYIDPVRHRQVSRRGVGRVRVGSRPRWWGSHVHTWGLRHVPQLSW